MMLVAFLLIAQLNAFMPDAPIYYLELTMRGCRVQSFVNGLPLSDNDAKAGAAFGSPFNANLVGKDNQVRIVVLPTPYDSGEVSTLEDVVVLGAVKKYGPDEIAGPESGDVIARFDFAEVIEKRKKEQEERLGSVGAISPEEREALLMVTFPLEHTISFDNEGPAFPNRFLEADIIDDEERLLRYAKQLLALMKNREAEGLYREFKPKMDDYNVAYPTEATDDAVAFPQFLQEQFFPDGPITKIEKEEIGLRRWCEGRIWELYVKPDQALFSTSGLNAQDFEIQVFVGLDHEELKVIR